jgi:hypothetical protein
MPEKIPSPVHGSSHEAKLDILDLLIVVLRHKLLIVACVLIAVAASFAYYAYFTPRTEYVKDSSPLYKSEVVMLTGEIEKIEAVIKSRQLLYNTIEKKNLLPRLFPEKWDQKNARWKVDRPPSMQDAYQKLRNSLQMKVDKTAFRDKVVFKDETVFMVTVTLVSHDTTLPQYALIQVVEELKVILRDLHDADEHKKGAVKVDIVDPPSPTEQIPPAIQSQQKPPLPVYVWGVPVLVFFLAVLLAFFLEYLKNLIKEEPDKYRKVKRNIGFRKRE